MKKLLIFTSLAEGGFGLLLLAAPAIVIKLLLSLDMDGEGAIMSRLSGLAILALAVACWPEEGAVRPYYGMLTWSMLAAAGLIAIAVIDHAGILLWPAVAIHTILAILLVRALRSV